MTVRPRIICWTSTKGKEPVNEKASESSDNASPKRKNIFKSYWEILKLRPVKFLGLSVILWALVCSMASSGPVYLMTNNLELSASKQSLVFTLCSLFAIMWVPVINLLCKKFDKKYVYCYAMMFSGAIMAIFGLIGISTFALLIAMIFFFTFGNTTFWTLYYSLMYDLNELDEYINGQRREGAIAALMGLCQKLGSALGLQILGIVLQIGEYGVAGQEERASHFIVYANTLIPGLIGILAAICVISYPMTKSRHQSLTSALEKKKHGDDYNEDNFQELLYKNQLKERN